MSANFTLVTIKNPFDPREHVREVRELSPGLTVQGVLGLVPGEHTVGINGGLIELEKHAQTLIRAGDFVVVCPVPEGGGKSKNILRIVAMIAITVISSGVGGWAAATFGSKVAGWVAGAVVSIAGSMLVNALLPPPKPTKAGGMDDSPSYGIDGAKNTAEEGAVVPVCYGFFRMGGNLINFYTENEGKTQIAYLLFNAGEGPVRDIDQFEINDQPLSAYQDVDIDTRLGRHTDPPLPWFNKTITPRNVGILLTNSFQTFTTIDVVDRFRLDFVCPNGLYWVYQKDGQTRGMLVDLEVQYRKVGDTTWLSMPTTDVITGYTDVIEYKDVTTCYGSGPTCYTQFNKPVTVKKPVYSPAMVISDKSQTPVRRSFMSPSLAQGKYEIRYRKIQHRYGEWNTNPILTPGGQWTSTTPPNISIQFHDVVLADVNEIIDDPVFYKHTALVGIKIRLNDQLNGLPKITYRNWGRMVRQWVNGSWQVVDNDEIANPAWVALDMLTNSRYGAALNDSRIDLQSFRDWATFCTANDLRFNGVIDGQSNLWEVLQAVGRVGRAQIVNVGTRYGVIIERASSPEMMFSVGNIVKGSFKTSWLPREERANEIEVAFYDETDSYRERRIRLYDSAALAAGLVPRKAEFTLVGVTRHSQAAKEAQLALNMNRLILQTCEFEAPLEAIGCSVGSVIYVQHDMPQWGDAGRTRSGSTTTNVVLDRPVTITPTGDFQLMVLYNAIQRYSGSVSSKTGDSLVLSGFNGLNPVKRLRVGALDVRVLSVYNAGGGNWGVVVENSTGISVGNAYTLWDTDVMETRDVTTAAGTVSSVTVSPALPSAPVAYQQWMFGEIGKFKKPFRVRRISGSNGETRRLECIEYNENVYDLSGTVYTAPNYSSLPFKVDHAVIGDITEELIKVGDTLRARVTVNFSSEQQTYKESLLWVSKNGGAFEKVNTGIDRVSMEADEGAILVFKVQALDAAGASASFATAPTTTYVVLGKTANPSDVTGLTAQVQGDGILLQWTEITDLDLWGYEVRRGTTWASAVSVYKGAETKYLHPPLSVGNHTFLVKAIDTGKRESDDPAVIVATVNGPSTPSVSFTVESTDAILSWNQPVSSVTIAEYEVRYGTSYATGTFVTRKKSLTHKVPINWTGDRTFWVAAIDTQGNTGAAGSTLISIAGPSTPALSSGLTSGLLQLSWNAVSSQLPLGGYEVRYGTSFASGTFVDRVSATSIQIPVNWQGSRTFWVAGYDVMGNFGTAASIVSTINGPAAPTVSYAFDGADLVLNWNAPTSQLPIDRYEIRHGASYGAGTFVHALTARTFRLPVKWAGSRTFHVAAIDSQDITGSAGSVTVAITAPIAQSLTPQVIDNNVLLRWNVTPGNLPVASYEVRRGATFAGATVIGPVSARFATIFEQQSGTYTYWVVPIDTAGNYGVETSTNATLSQPPDYVLYLDQDSALGGTVVNGVSETEGILFMVNATETYAQHFTNNSWASPQAQINAGYPIMIQPSASSGSYEEVIDKGGVVAAAKVTMTPNTELISGSVTITPRISVSNVSATGPWTDFTNTYAAYASNFRWIKIRLDFAGSGGDDLIRLKGVNTRLDVKLKSDAGMGTASSGDAGGTTVNFTVSFTDVNSITITPLGTTARYGIYDFVDVANPTSFKVLLFNNAGTRVSGDFSWSAVGV